MKFFPFFLAFALVALTSCAKDEIVPGLGEGSLAEMPDASLLAEIAQDEAAAAAELNDHLAAFEAKSNRLTIPAGSHNALAAAIAAIDRNGVIRLAEGDHHQDGTLTISKPVNIIGDPGARLLISGTTPLGVGPQLEGGIHVYKTEFVRIRNLELVPVGGEGATAILVQNAPHTFVSRVTAKDWQNGVVAEKSPKLYVERSEFIGSSQWQTNPNFPVFGIVVVNGERATIFNNTIRNTVFGVWACDKFGRLGYNKLSGNFNGIELCKVPVSFPLPNGDVVGSDFPATRWLTYHNESNNNFNNGFEIIDGANNCLLVNNIATGNGALDFEFAGPTERYGFAAPTSSRNRAFLAKESRWADCGDGNRVRSGIEVEGWTCF